MRSVCAVLAGAATWVTLSGVAFATLSSNAQSTSLDSEVAPNGVCETLVAASVPLPGIDTRSSG